MNKIKLLNFFKKFTLISFVLAIFLFSFARKTEAFETPSLNYSIQFEQALDSDDMNLQSFVNETIKAVSASILRLITGSFFQISEEEFFGKQTNLLNPQKIGLLSATGMVMTGIYTNPPASGIQYLAILKS